MNLPARRGDTGLERSGLRAEILSFSELTDRHCQAWQELADRVLDPNVFYEPIFALAAFDHLPLGKNVRLVFVWDEGGRPAGRALAAVIPLALARRWPLPFRAAIGWHHPFAVLTNPLLAAGSETAALGLCFERLASLPSGPRYVLWPLLAHDSPTARALADFALCTRRPTMELASHRRAQLVCSGARSPHRGLSAKRRRQIRRQRRRLEELGRVDLVTASQGEALDQALESFLALEEAGWKGREGTAARCDPRTAAFLRQAVVRLGEAGKLRIDRLLLDGEPLAATITLRSGGSGALWKIAYSEAHARFAPGVQLLCEISGNLAADPLFARVDSCTLPGHRLIESLWGDRLSIAARLVFVRPDESALVAAACLASERIRKWTAAQAKGTRRLVRELRKRMAARQVAAPHGMGRVSGECRGMPQKGRGERN